MINLAERVQTVHTAANYFGGAIRLYDKQPKLEFDVAQHEITIELTEDTSVQIRWESVVLGVVPAVTEMLPRVQECQILRNRIVSAIGLAKLRFAHGDVKRFDTWA